MSEPKLFRGKHFGVFAGADGYYVGRMHADGQSHGASSGRGWDERTLAACNQEAQAAEADEADLTPYLDL